MEKQEQERLRELFEKGMFQSGNDPLPDDWYSWNMALDVDDLLELFDALGMVPPEKVDSVPD